MAEKKSAKVSKGETAVIEATKIELGVSWDLISGQAPVDVDASLIQFSDVGNIRDAVFYNKTRSDDGSTVHSGDNKTGAAASSGDDDERITVDLTKVTAETKCMCLCVTCYSGGTFHSVETAEATIRNGETKKELVEIPPLGSLGTNTALVLSVFFRDASGRWNVKNVSTTGPGRNFKECEPLMRKVIEFLIPLGEQEEGRGAPDAKKVFQLEKGGVFDVGSTSQDVWMGLGWDIDERHGSCDLDASCLYFGADGSRMGTVYFGNKSAPGITHSGDNLTGAGEGDDEQIVIEFAKIPSPVVTLVFTVTIYSQGRDFTTVSNAFCRLVDRATQREMCRFSLSDLGTSTALVMCKLTREGSGWKMLAIGEPASGRVPSALEGVCTEWAKVNSKAAASEVSERQRKYLAKEGGSEHHHKDKGCCLM